VYLGHNVFERHKTFDFPRYSQHPSAVRPFSAASFQSHTADSATQQAIDSEIVRWATAIPDNLPLNLSALPVMLRSANEAPPPTEYAIMAFLAIFETPEKRLTDEGIFGALKDGFTWFRTHSEDDFWKRQVINCMRCDTRFKASHEGGRSWTVDISEVHRRPFVHREARDRPSRLLPPGPQTSASSNRSSVSQRSADYLERGRGSVTPARSGSSTDSRRSSRQQEHATGDTSRGTSSGVSHVHSVDPLHHPVPPARSPLPLRGKSNSSQPLPPYSEVLYAGESSRARRDHIPAAPAARDNLVLPSIRDVLGTEMHMVQERGRSTGF